MSLSLLKKPALRIFVPSICLFGIGLIVWESKVLLIEAEEITLEANGIRLATTLALPRGATQPVPAMVVVHGSGRTPRNNVRGFVSEWVPEGVAVLIFDKRGVAFSTGQYRQFQVADCEQMLQELANDVNATVAYLKTRPEIDSTRIGLIGGSQAGWIMPTAATQNTDIAFIASLSGPAVSCGQITAYQRMTGTLGNTPSDLPLDAIQERVAAFSGPHGNDPVRILNQVNIPMLWILGESDRHVPATLTQSIVLNLASAAPNQHTVLLYPNADHDLNPTTDRPARDPKEDILVWLRHLRLLPP